MILLKGDPVLTNDVFLVSAASESMTKEKDLTRPDFSDIHVAAGFAFDINWLSFWFAGLSRPIWHGTVTNPNLKGQRRLSSHWARTPRKGQGLTTGRTIGQPSSEKWIYGNLAASENVSFFQYWRIFVQMSEVRKKETYGHSRGDAVDTGISMPWTWLCCSKGSPFLNYLFAGQWDSQVSSVFKSKLWSGPYQHPGWVVQEIVWLCRKWYAHSKCRFRHTCGCFGIAASWHCLNHRQNQKDHYIFSFRFRCLALEQTSKSH